MSSPTTPSPLVSALLTQGTAAASYAVQRRVNTGDRVLDTLVSAFVAVLSDAGSKHLLAAVASRKALGLPLLLSYLSLRKSGARGPLDFTEDEALADATPEDRAAATHTLVLPYAPLSAQSSVARVFAHWLVHHHGARYTAFASVAATGDNADAAPKMSTWVMRLRDREELERGVHIPMNPEADESGSSAAEQAGHLLLGKPVWREPSDGAWVYLSGTNVSTAQMREAMLRYEFKSRSRAALEAFVTHVATYARSLPRPPPPAPPSPPTRAAELREQPIQRFNCAGTSQPYIRATGFTISTKRNFDSLFFTDKDKLVRLVRAFCDGTLVPAHLPLPSNLLILVHGPPGCGKTSIAAAMALTCGRPLVIADVSRMSTQTEFDAMLTAATTNVVLLDEIDRVPGVLRHKKKAAEGDSAGDDNATHAPRKTVAEMLLERRQMAELGGGGTEDKAAAAYTAQLMRQVDDERNGLNLGYILSALSGVVQRSGMVIVATTNHPDLIDPALKRAGRFALLELSWCTLDMAQRILAFCFQVSVADVAARLHAVPPQLSPAKLVQLYQEERELEATVAAVQRLAGPRAA